MVKEKGMIENNNIEMERTLGTANGIFSVVRELHGIEQKIRNISREISNKLAELLLLFCGQHPGESTNSRRSHLPDSLRWRAIGWLEMGMSQADAARRLNVSLNYGISLNPRILCLEDMFQTDLELQHLRESVI
ncbi:hypothetical protein X975_12934, partial [Stegodyphus mimosarum]